MKIIRHKWKLPTKLECCGALAQSVERPSNGPRSRCKSTDETWVQTQAAVGKKPSRAIWRKNGINCADWENVAKKVEIETGCSLVLVLTYHCLELNKEYK